MRKLVGMNSITAGTHAFEDEVLQVFAEAKSAHPHTVDSSILAMMCVERDTRFYADTLRAVLQQSVLPGTLAIVDCAGRVSQIMQTTMEISLAADSLMDVMRGTISSHKIRENAGKRYTHSNEQAEHKFLRIIIIPVSSARSFGDGIEKALRQLMPLQGISALWLLHDDSRPANNYCLESLRETWRNTPTASVLGAKQVDWNGKILHNVGMYAWKHDVHTLTVDGEPDQEQYDGRGDVYAVSLAGALVTLSAWQTLRGTQPWMTTFRESQDFCRRVCLSGGRVVVVPSARIAHRRARLEGIRTRSGEARSSEKSGFRHAVGSSLIAKQRYWYTDTRMLLWPLMWLCSLPMALIGALRSLVAKRPYVAWVRLMLPWIAIMQFPHAMLVRRRVARSTRIPLKKLTQLVADRRQVARWRDRSAAFQAQQHCVLLSPLARQHLHIRVLRRWSAVIAASLVLFAVTLYLYGAPWREMLGGASWYAQQWLPTGADFHQVWNAAIGAWVPDDGFGPALPPSAWLSVWALASLIVGANPLLAITLMFFLAAPALCLSFWALAGVFTRSDMVRVCAGVCWTMVAMAFGLFARGDLPMLMTMVFLPAAFAFAFHAVGMYVTEDPVRPVSSVQCAACAALCFMIPVAAEPQLLLPLIIIFIASFIMVRSHRIMFLLMPIPSIVIVLPTIGSAIRYGSSGMWRQLFSSAALPLRSVQGAPRAQGYIDVLLHAFNMTNVQNVASIPIIGLRTIIMIIFAVLAVVMAVVALMLPFALRVSRMMWVLIISGMALSLVAARIVVAADITGPVAASVLPGVSLSIIGVLSCMCMVAGQAVRRFEPLRAAAISKSEKIQSYKTRADKRAAMRRSAARLLQHIIHVARAVLASGMLTMAVLLCLFAVISGPVTSIAASNNGLPMVVADYLRKDDTHRVLALRAKSNHDLSIAVMRTIRGDAVDVSPALFTRQVIFGDASSTKVLSRAAAQLLSHADSGAIEALKQLGIGGIYIVNDAHRQAAVPSAAMSIQQMLHPSARLVSDVNKEATERLIAHVNAAEGTQLVVSMPQGTYFRFDGMPDARSLAATSPYHHARPLAWRIPWMLLSATVLLLYCLVAVPRFGRHTMIERGDDQYEEECDELA